MQVGHNELRDYDGANPVSHDVLLNGTAKGWVGIGTPGSADETYNVSSQTDSGVGGAGVNWDADMSSDSYPLSVTFSGPSSTSSFARYNAWNQHGLQAVGSVRVELGYESGSSVTYSDSQFHASATGRLA